ncbi:hypothetical protein V9T40_000287 [Parthenolecanium corni]|uniref:AIP/AIPL N-terminal FKBP-type PPIase domain-containing protein n=1 Tax=Parthenolecanium corni TaxID=536013 RepID=A0AAN9Y1K6_9HEMI
MGNDPHILVEEYPVVAKVYRDDALGKPSTRVHHCHASLVTAGLGYDDLNELMKSPRDLKFIFEILKVEYPGQYEQELWQIKDENKLELIPKLREEGNKFYATKDYTKALEKYELALMFIDQFQLREKPRDVEWNHYNEMKVPFLLNSAQCKLCLGEYYAAIEKCNAVLEIDKENIKAIFRRGKAHIKVWNLEDAKRDFEKVLELDSSQKNAVAAAMADLRKAENESKMVEKSIIGSKLF